MKYLRNIVLLLFAIAIISGSKEVKGQPDLTQYRDHIKFIESFPDSLRSAHKLAVMCTTFGKEKTIELFRSLTQRVKDSEDGKQISKYLSINKDPKVGDYFIDFEMQTPNGEIRKLSELKGKVVLLEFWASWCGPCQGETPQIKKVYDEFHGDGFEIFAVSFDIDKKSWLKYIEDNKLNWTHVSELKSIGNTAGLIYGIHAIPDNFLINKDGIIIARNISGDYLGKKLKEVMK